MLVQLPHGMCVNPEIVKLIHVRADKPNPREPAMVYSVLLKTDDDGFLVIAAYTDREEAEALSEECARRINRGLGEGEDEPKAASSAAADDDDDDLDDVAEQPQAAAAGSENKAEEDDPFDW